MEAASRVPLEPLSEAGPEMPAAPTSRPGTQAKSAATGSSGAPLDGLDPDLAPLALEEDLPIAPPPPVARNATPAAAPSPPVPPVTSFAPAAPAARAKPAAPLVATAATSPASVAATSAASVPAANLPSASAASPAAAPGGVVVPPVMDRDFIARNQIVERYISGRLPVKGATDFERFCTENPGILDELGLPERVNAGLRLLEAAGKPEPWQEEPKKFWEKPQLLIGLAVATLALLITVAVMANGLSSKSRRIDVLQKLVREQPLNPATSTRTARLLPSYQGGSNTPAIELGGIDKTELADLKIDLSRSQYRAFRVTIDRIDQGRVAILHNLEKDSNGHLRIALNTSALGPGSYQFTIEGLTWRGETVPEAWVTVGIAR